MTAEFEPGVARRILSRTFRRGFSSRFSKPVGLSIRGWMPMNGLSAYPGIRWLDYDSQSVAGVVSRPGWECTPEG